MKKFLLTFFIILLQSTLLAHGYELKPGVVITNKNYEEYILALQTLLIPCNFNNVVNGLKKGWITLKIQKKLLIPTNKGYLEASARNKGKFKLKYYFG